jgi:hypothetical protein
LKKKKKKREKEETKMNTSSEMPGSKEKLRKILPIIATIGILLTCIVAFSNHKSDNLSKNSIHKRQVIPDNKNICYTEQCKKAGNNSRLTLKSTTFLLFIN